jgi:hypothetical protein
MCAFTSSGVIEQKSSMALQMACFLWSEISIVLLFVHSLVRVYFTASSGQREAVLVRLRHDGDSYYKQEDGLLTRGNNKQLYPTEDEMTTTSLAAVGLLFQRNSCENLSLQRQPTSSVSICSSNEDHCLALAT